ncbi:MAG: hypothetical protein ACOWWM_10720 [Desulfobacterales bacterium]
MDRKAKLLAILGVVLLLVLGYRLLNPYEQPTVDRLTYDGGARAAGVPSAAENEPEPAGQSLEVAAEIYLKPDGMKGEVKRDPFNKVQAAPASPAPAPSPRAAAPPPLTAEDRVRQAFEDFKTFGSFAHGDRSVLFLQRGKQVVLVSRGDRIDGRYQVLDFTDDTLTVSGGGVDEPVLIQLEELPESPGSGFRPGSASTGGARFSPPAEPDEEFETPPEESIPEEEEIVPELTEEPEEQPETSPSEAEDPLEPTGGPTPRGGTGLEPSFAPQG